MLFSNDKFVKRSLYDFLHIDCLNKDIDIKEKLGFFFIKDTVKNGEKIFSRIPKNITNEVVYKEEKYLKITKADLLRYQKEQMANPIRTWSNDDEYGTRLTTFLLLQATPKWAEYCKNLYDHGQDRYIHDQRAGSGKAKQFLNWMYSDEGYPGRLDEKNEYEGLIPLCFPNPELLRENFTYLGGGQYSLNILDNWENSVLYKTLNDSKLLHKFTIQNADNKGRIKKAIIAPFCIWQEAITQILQQKDLEKQLSFEQQKTHIVSLIIEFVKNQDKDRKEIQSVEQLQEKVTSFIQSMSKQQNNEDNRTAIQNVIKALYKIRQNITANKEFFDKFTNDMGVLQAEQYFRALTAHIDSEITFLDVFKNNLTQDDLNIFLDQTCKEVHSDVSELLLAHDFFLADNLNHRDMVINLTRKEVKELHQYISEKIKDYSTKGIKENKHKWLLKQLELNPLFEFFSTQNTGGVDELWKVKVDELWKVKVDELWKTVEDNDALNNKKAMLKFTKQLEKIVNGPSNDSPDDKNSDNKNKVYIELSRWLAFKQWLYNISYYIPLSSIWLSHINPSESRTGTKYTGSSFTEKLYTKNKVIPVSEFSQSIRKDLLDLRTEGKEFVESKHEANWLVKEFRKKHKISGAREKVLTYLGKNKVLWYTLLSVFILLTSAAAIAGRVLSYLGIIPPVAVDRMINSLRGIFDGFVIMFGLDTIIDSIFILAVDFAGIVVRVVDFILLFGLVSKAIRCLTKGIGKIVEGISDGFKSIYETIRVYGLKGSFILLHDKITTNDKQHKACEAKKEEKPVEKEKNVKTAEELVKQEKKKGIMMGDEHRIDNIFSAAQKSWQKSKDKSIKDVFSNLKSSIETHLLCMDPKFPVLLKNFKEIYDLNNNQDHVKPSIDWNFIRLQYEFHYLLKKYPEKFSNNMQYAKQDVTAEQPRMKMYHKMVDGFLKTKQANCQESKEKVTSETLNKKIAAIEWAINTVKHHDIDFAINKAEPVFKTTKTHISAEVAFRDYSKKLKELREDVKNGKQVSVDELNSYEMIFARYIADMHHIISSATTKNCETSSLHKFREAFSSNILLKSPSHEAENATLILGIDRGGISMPSRVKEYVTDFVHEFQDPKVFAVAFAVYYIAIEIPYLIDAAHTITDVPEMMLNLAGLGAVHDDLTKTYLAEKFFEMFYERAELFKDLWVLGNEFKDGVIGETEMQKRLHEIEQRTKKSHDHHDHGCAKERLMSFINSLVHFISTILGINLIRSLLHDNETKTEYRTFSDYEQKGSPTITAQSQMEEIQVEATNHAIEEMYSVSEIPSELNDPKLLEQVLHCFS